MSINHLAILGGPPEFAAPLHVGRPNIPNRAGFERRLAQALDSGWLTNDGPMVRELEEKVCSYLGVEHCIAVANATLGLELCMRALELKGEVILPSFTFVATAHAVVLAGLEPVFCDINPLTHNLEPAMVEGLVTERTAAILGVHVWGRPCAIDELEVLSKRQGLPLLLDAAHAFACSHNDKRLGGSGRAEVFSLHATKFIHSFEGGLITTNDGALASRLRLARNFGFVGYDRVEALGTNAKLSEVHAAMALANLESVGSLLEHNREVLRTYRREMAGVPGIELADTWREGAGNAQYVVAEVMAGSEIRDRLLQGLHRENVLARRYFYPGAHRFPPYDTRSHPTLPATEALSGRVIVLPTGLGVGPKEAMRVSRLVALLLRAL